MAGILEIAEALVGIAPRPRRPVLLALWDGEEKGLLGSRFLAKDPALKGMRMIADINLDMYLPLYPLKVMRVQITHAANFCQCVKDFSGMPSVSTRSPPFKIKIS